MRIALYVGAAIALVGASIPIASRIIGQVIESETKEYQSRLLKIEGVSVTRLTYEKGWLAGKLYYDLAWRPPANHPVSVLLREESQTDELPVLKLSGMSHVQQGPWTGKPVLASTSLAPYLPETWRDYLPKFPGQDPWITVDATIDFSRRLTATFRLTDYDGPITSGESPLDLKIRGTSGTFSVLHGAQDVLFEATLDEASFGTPLQSIRLENMGIKVTSLPATKDNLRASLVASELSTNEKSDIDLSLRVRRVALRFDGVREWSHIWAGTTSLKLEDVGLIVDDTTFSLKSISLETDTVRTDDLVSQIASLNIDGASIASIALPSVAAKMSLRNLNGTLLNELLDALNVAEVTGTEEVRGALRERAAHLAPRIIEGGLEIRLDRLALSVQAPDDIELSSSLKLEPQPKTRIENIGETLRALRGEAALTSEIAALEELNITAAKLGASQEHGATLTESEIDDVRLQFRTTRTEIEALPYIKFDKGKATVHATLNDGKLLVNGQKVDLFDAPLPGLVFPHPRERSPPPVSVHQQDGNPAKSEKASRSIPLNPSGTPEGGILRLTADFQPDPQTRTVRAGGSISLNVSLGPECVGYTNENPDLTVVYSAGVNPLFFFSEAEDDTALVVHLPDGRWLCSDDADQFALNPLIRIAQPQNGRYSVWVSSVDGLAYSADISVSEVDPR